MRNYSRKKMAGGELVYQMLRDAEVEKGESGKERTRCRRLKERERERESVRERDAHTKMGET